MNSVCSSSATEVIDFFNSNELHGLNEAAVSKLQQIHGANKFDVEEKDPIALRFLEQFKDPLILMLLGSALLSIIVGQIEDALSILGAVLIVGSVAFYQEYQSEKSLEALTTLVPPRCNVIRNGGITKNILAEELIPGDIIRLQAGDRVPADCRIISCTSFAIDESTLTGESEQCNKTNNILSHITDYNNIH